MMQGIKLKQSQVCVFLSYNYFAFHAMYILATLVVALEIISHGSSPY